MRRERWTHNGIGTLVQKSGGGGGFDAGVVSSQVFTGDCFVEWTVNDLAQNCRIGLSAEQGIDPAAFDYMIRYDVTDYSVYEDNVLKLFATGLALNDVLRIERQGQTVRFRRNGVVYYTSSTPSTRPLYLCIGIATAAGTVYDLKYGVNRLDELPAVFDTRQNVTVTSARVEAYGSRLLKTGAAAAHDAGASSVELLAGDGYVEAVVDATGVHRFLGLSTSDDDVNYTSIDFAFYVTTTDNIDGQWQIWESGVNVQSGAAASIVVGDVVRVERVGTTITYKKNGAVIWTSTTPSIGALLVDVSMFTPGVKLDNVRMYDAGVRVSLTWQNAVGVRAIGDSLRIQAVANTLTWDLHNRDGVHALMTAEPPRGYTGSNPFNTNAIFGAIEPVLLPAGAEAGLVYADWSWNHFLFFGVRNLAGVYQVVYQRLRSDGSGSDALPVVLGVTSLTKHWLRLRPGLNDSFAGTIVEAPYDFSFSTTGSAEGNFTTTTGIIWRRSIGWWGHYVRGSWASPVDIRFAESLYRNVAGTRPFYWYALRDPALPGAPDLVGARAVARRMKHGFTHASAIVSRSFLCDDPNSVTDECPLGAL
jgi:hypothetical protein